MKNIVASLSFLATLILSPLSANWCEQAFYLRVGSGISFAQRARVEADPSTWAPAVQGYNSRLGNRAIAELGIGCEWMHALDLEASISHRSAFKYRKFQTPVSGGASYTREFDLDVTPILFSARFLGQNVSCLNWNIGCGRFYPIVGAGIGVSNLLITNFRTTGLPPTGDSSPNPSFSNENEYTRRRNFTYAALVGFEYNYHDSWAVSTGYRWLDAGQFNGPRFFRVASGSAVDVGNRNWKIHFRSNEWFIDFKIFI
jgi:opacity protein-like surface antigen